MHQQMLFASLAGASGYIIEHSVFFDGTSQYLTWTPSQNSTSQTSAGDGSKFTLSMWVKRTNFGSDAYLFESATNDDGIRFDGSSNQMRFFFSTAGSGDLQTKAKFIDCSAWQHWVFSIDTDQGTSTNRVKLYLNGSQIADGDLGTNTYPAEHYDLTWVANGILQTIGRLSSGSSYYDGYLAEVVMLDGTAVSDCSDLGELSDDGIWGPKDPSGLTFGNNGFYLKFADSSDFGTDSSGNGNDFTANGSMAATQQVEDSPTNDADNNIGNYATFNANIAQTSRNTNTIAGGNLHWSGGGGDGIAGTHSFGTSGKWYWEQTAGDADSYVIHGIISKSVYNSNDMTEGTSASGFDTLGGDGEAFGWYRGNKWEKTSTASYGSATSAADDVVMLALDIDNNKIWYGVNGTWISSGNPATGANASSTITSGIEWYPWAGSFTGDPVVNFG